MVGFLYFSSIDCSISLPPPPFSQKTVREVFPVTAREEQYPTHFVLSRSSPFLSLSSPQGLRHTEHVGHRNVQGPTFATDASLWKGGAAMWNTLHAYPTQQPSVAYIRLRWATRASSLGTNMFRLHVKLTIATSNQKTDQRGTNHTRLGCRGCIVRPGEV